MKSIYKNLGAVIGFSVVVLLVQNIAGEKAGQYTVLFTLISMMVLNSEKVVNKLNSFK